MAEYGTAFFKAKQMELGDKMDLASYLLKPVQRMGKYALLLQQLVKAGTDHTPQLPSEDDEGKDEKDNPRPMVEGEADLRAAEQMVRFQLRHGNDLLAMDSLRDCDVSFSFETLFFFRGRGVINLLTRRYGVCNRCRVVGICFVVKRLLCLNLMIILRLFCYRLMLRNRVGYCDKTNFWYGRVKERSACVKCSSSRILFCLAKPVDSPIERYKFIH